MNQLSTTSEINIASCTSLEEVQETLSLMAQNANKSLAHALKAQIQVVKYISKPDLYGSTFDLFFKNLKKSINYAEDEENVYEIREQASLMLNNFVFFMKAKIEWEVAVNRKEGEALFVEAANGLAETMTSLAAMYYGGSGKAALKVTGTQKLSKLFFNPDKNNDNWFKKAGRWLFKSSRTEEKISEFLKTLDCLAEKLVDQYDVIGSNDLIAGIFENYRDDLIESHSYEWEPLLEQASEYREKSWGIPGFILGIGGVLSGIVCIFRWIISLFSEPSPGWASTQWMWTGIVLGGASIIVAVIYLVLSIVRTKQGNQRWKECVNYYNSVISLFKE